MRTVGKVNNYYGGMNRMHIKLFRIFIICIGLMISFTVNAQAACNHFFQWTWKQSTDGLMVKDLTSADFPSVIASSWYAWNGINDNVSLSYTTSVSSTEEDINLYDEALTGSTLAYTAAYKKTLGIWSQVSITDFSGNISKAIIVFDNRNDDEGRFVRQSHERRTKTTIHELGHALGLHHPTCLQSSVMHQGFPDDDYVSAVVTDHDEEMLRVKW